MTVTENDIKGYIFEDGEDTREVGERLAASYVNFYFCNGAVILPQFGGENAESDRVAAEILERVCKGRKIIPIYARDIIVGGAIFIALHNKFRLPIREVKYEKS